MKGTSRYETMRVYCRLVLIWCMVILMHKIFLIGINAKFIHSNLAIRSIKSYVEKITNVPIGICEFTINQPLELIIREIYKLKPDLIGFSCYIWNYDLVKKLTKELKKILPRLQIYLGGPEVSYDCEMVEEETGCSGVISGEGEQEFAAIVASFTGCRMPPSTTEPIPLEVIPFVYDFIQDHQLSNRIYYYEASRGCPFHCEYCLSSGSNGLRFLPLERVFEDLTQFLKAEIRQVKLVDRTFNCNKEYAMSIWKFLSQNDNHCTNFHFEIAAELLDIEMISFLQTVRTGLFQFEIGVQSTNQATLNAIKRNTDTVKLTETVKALQKNSNIHLHLDLIAGLPYEDITAFSLSFNYVYRLKPDQFQLGFLKVLKGSELFEKRAEYGLVYTDYPPYEILATPSLSVYEILTLKMVEEIVETYYNSNRYKLTIRYLETFFDTPFALFLALAWYYDENKLHLSPHSKEDYYTILHDFFGTVSSENDIDFQWFALFDIYSHEKAKKIPAWLTVKLTEYKLPIYDFVDNRGNVQQFLPEYQEFDTKQIIRNAHIQAFPFDVTESAASREVTMILFNYRQCDLLGTAKTTKIKLGQQSHDQFTLNIKGDYHV